MDTTIILRTCTAWLTEKELKVAVADLERYLAGEHVQRAFPYLTPGQREMLLSGLCGDCFDKLF